MLKNRLLQGKKGILGTNVPRGTLNNLTFTRNGIIKKAITEIKRKKAEHN